MPRREQTGSQLLTWILNKQFCDYTTTSWTNIYRLLSQNLRNKPLHTPVNKASDSSPLDLHTLNYIATSIISAASDKNPSINIVSGSLPIKGNIWLNGMHTIIPKQHRTTESRCNLLSQSSKRPSSILTRREEQYLQPNLQKLQPSSRKSSEHRIRKNHSSQRPTTNLSIEVLHSW